MRIVTGLLLAVWVCGAPQARAAVPESPLLRVIGVADGLPSSNVNGLAQDRAGYLWLATTDGLARYDGVGVRVWRHVPGDARSLPGNYVAAVHVDGDDRVWVAIEGRGVSMLDAGHDGSSSIARPRIRRSAATIPGRSPASGARHGSGRSATFGDGLHRLDGVGDGSAARITRFMPGDGDPRNLPSDTVLSMCVDARQRLWVGTTQGLARWTGRDFERVALPGDMPAQSIFSVTPDGDALWVGARSGLYRYEADGRWTVPAWASMFAWPNAVFGIVPDRDGHWLASHRNLWRVTPGTVPHPVPIGEHGPVRPMYQMLRQANGAMWFPVSGAGLGYLRPDWRRTAQFSREKGQLGSDLYRGVAPAAQGGAWLAGHRGESSAWMPMARGIRCRIGRRRACMGAVRSLWWRMARVACGWASAVRWCASTAPGAGANGPLMPPAMHRRVDRATGCGSRPTARGGGRRRAPGSSSATPAAAACSPVSCPARRKAWASATPRRSSSPPTARCG